MPYTLNGQPVSIDQEPVDKDGTVFVPFKKVVEGLGGTVNWDNEIKQATATIGQWTALFTLGAQTADVNGTTVQFSTPSYDETGRTVCPRRLFPQRLRLQSLRRRNRCHYRRVARETRQKV